MQPIWSVLLIVFIVFINHEAAAFKFEHTLGHIKTKTTSGVQKTAVENLIKRTIPDRYSEFTVIIDSDLVTDGKDLFKLVSTNDGKIQITGTTGVAAASGFNYYLKYFCNAHISWELSQLSLPSTLASVNVTITFNDRYRYYQNVCTTSYSFVWWDWRQWEKHIDWIVLNSFNFVLAFNGQEAIWKRVYQKLNLTNTDIDEHFSGPAFLSWLRMGNLRGWGGPLSDSWHDRSLNLQHQILDRLRDFGVITILPAFAGHVPRAFHDLFPDTNMTLMAKWNNFADRFCCPYFIDPTEDIFQTIGKMFIEEQIAEYGTDHVYNCDSFNEMEPSSTDLTYLSNVGKSIFSAMRQADPEAIWVLQGWMFYNDAFWNDTTRAESFLTSVPTGQMIVLDLQSEQFPQYDRMEQYFGQPYIWCMLHNFGGTLGMYGSADIINTEVIKTRNSENSTMIGTGLTMEGINQNYVIYDLMSETAWRSEPANLSEWFRDYSRRRYGRQDNNVENAWEILKVTIYNFSGTERIRGHFAITRSPSLDITTWAWYKYKDLFDAWDYFLQSADNYKDSPGYLHDLVDLTRQVLQANGDIYYNKLILAFQNKNVTEFQQLATIFKEIFVDLENILGTNEAFLLGKWIDAAKKCANGSQEEKLFEYNARNQITLWGPFGEIMDYAVKQWSGVAEDYLYPRWNAYIDYMNYSLVHNTTFHHELTKTIIFLLYEEPFCFSNKEYPTEPTGDAIEIAREIQGKYWYTNHTDVLNKINMQIPARPKKSSLKYKNKTCKKSKDCPAKNKLSLRRFVSKMRDLDPLHSYFST